MKFCKPIKPIELFSDEELADAFSCGGQHLFAIEIYDRWQKQIHEIERLRAIVERSEEVRSEQRSGRQKYGRGPDDTAHDDTHTVSEWADFITYHASRARVATPIESRQELLKVAGLAFSAIESFDRKAAVAVIEARPLPVTQNA